MPGRLRFLLITQARVPGAAPHGPAIASMARALRGEIDIVTVKGSQQAHQGRLGEARIFRVRAEDGPDPFIRAVVRQVESEPYDVIHSRDARSVPAIAATGYGGHIIYEMSAEDLSAGWEERHWAALQAAHHIIVPTLAAAQAAQHIVADKPIHHLPPGVDVDVYDWQPKRVVEPALTRLLALGDFGPGRDLASLIGAVRRVRKTVPVHLMLAGESDARRRIEVLDEIEDAGVAPFITVRGDPRPEDVPRLIADSDIGIVAAAPHPAFIQHGLIPEPLLEYWCSHRPVIAPDWPSVRELMGDGHGTIHYAPGDPDSLSEAIGQAAANPSLGDTLGSARNQIRQGNPTSGRERALRQLYETLIPGSQVADSWAEAFIDEGSGTYEGVPASTTDQEAESAIVGEATRVDADLEPEQTRETEV